jgi:hypothetical protein
MFKTSLGLKSDYRHARRILAMVLNPLGFEGTPCELPAIIDRLRPPGFSGFTSRGQQFAVYRQKIGIFGN